MHGRKGHLRGLGDLKTLSLRGAHGVAPHSAYMKITSLELEKVRLGRVRHDAMRRIAEIDARYEDINAEKAGLLAAIADGTAAEPPASAVPQADARAARRPRSGFNPRRGRGISLRY